MTTMLEPMPSFAAEPREFSAQDGQYLHLRRVAQDDTAILTDMLLRVSDQSRRFRYFTFRTFSLEDAWSEAERMTRDGEGDQIAVMAAAPRPAGDEAVAVAELTPDARDPEISHLAVLVRDDRQRQGIGTALVRHLLTLAQARGIAAIRANLLAENHAARRLLDRLGLIHEARTRWGETEVLARLAAPATTPGAVPASHAD